MGHTLGARGCCRDGRVSVFTLTPSLTIFQELAVGRERLPQVSPRKTVAIALRAMYPPDLLRLSPTILNAIWSAFCSEGARNAVLDQQLDESAVNFSRVVQLGGLEPPTSCSTVSVR